MHDILVKKGQYYAYQFPISTVAELKSALVKNLSQGYPCLAACQVFQLVNEASVLAASTEIPLLVLPELAEEKVRQAAARAAGRPPFGQEGQFSLAA